MLERLTAVLESVSGSRPPLAVAALEAAALLLEVLGEISPEQVAALEQPVAAKLVAPHSCVRRQVKPCHTATKNALGCSNATAAYSARPLTPNASPSVPERNDWTGA